MWQTVFVPLRESLQAPVLTPDSLTMFFVLEILRENARADNRNGNGFGRSEKVVGGREHVVVVGERFAAQ